MQLRMGMLIVVVAVAAACSGDGGRAGGLAPSTTQAPPEEVVVDLAPKVLTRDDLSTEWNQVTGSSAERPASRFVDLCEPLTEVSGQLIGEDAEVVAFVGETKPVALTAAVSPGTREDYDEIAAAIETCVAGVTVPNELPVFSYHGERVDLPVLGEVSSALRITVDPGGVRTVFTVVIGYRDGVLATIATLTTTDEVAVPQLSDDEISTIVQAASARLGA